VQQQGSAGILLASNRLILFKLLTSSREPLLNSKFPGSCWPTDDLMVQAWDKWLAPVNFLLLRSSKVQLESC